MPIDKHLDARKKINVLLATLPDDMTVEEAELSKLAATIYDIPTGQATWRLLQVISAVKNRCGSAGSLPDDFPQAAEARSAIYVLEGLVEIV